MSRRDPRGRGTSGSGRASRVAVVERGRVPLSSSTAAPGVRLAVDVLIEKGPRADIYTCHLDVAPPLASAAPNPAGQIRRILAAERLTSVEGLERLSIDPSTQYRARNLVIKAEDVEIRLPEGRVFVVRSGVQLTAAVLLGEGDVTFTPS